ILPVLRHFRATVRSAPPSCARVAPSSADVLPEAAGFLPPAEMSSRGTGSSNPSPSSGESPANLSFRRIEVRGRSREPDGDSRGGEHQGCAAVQQLTASPAADATESTVDHVLSVAWPAPILRLDEAPRRGRGALALARPRRWTGESS